MSETVVRKKIEGQFYRFGTIVVGRILYCEPSLYDGRSSVILRRPNGFTVCSGSNPEIRRDRLYIWGSNGDIERKSRALLVKLDSETEAERLLENIKDSINEINSR